jgi:hypothetical protein
LAVESFLRHDDVSFQEKPSNSEEEPYPQNVVIAKKVL